MTVLKKGTLVRRTMHNGMPYGPVNVVLGSEDGILIIKSIESINIIRTVKRGDTVEIKTPRIQIVDDVYKRVRHEWQKKIIHAATPAWIKLAQSFEKEDIKYILLRNFSFCSDFMIFELRNVQVCTYMGRKEVTICLGKKVYENT